MPTTTPNNDENMAGGLSPFMGNFHKTLPHDKYGEVDPASYRAFVRVCVEVEAGAPTNFEAVVARQIRECFCATGWIAESL